MKIATALTVLAVGAILAFAVRANPPGLDIHTVGWVVMLTGVAGMVLPGQAQGWLRRRIVVRRGPVGPAEQSGPAGQSGSAGQAGPAERADDDAPYPSYVLHDPAALASAILQDAELSGAAEDEPETTPAAATVPRLAAVRLDDDEAAGQAGTLDDLLAGRTADGQGGRR
jgi:hypothetical protein